MPTFKFTFKDLEKIVEEHPEAEEEIRLDIDGELVKCGGCNWKTSLFFVLANTREEAIKLLVSGDPGLCGECYAEMLTEVRNRCLQWKCRNQMPKLRV